MSTLAVVIVDHGSRRDEANTAFLEVVRRFADSSRFAIVEPAHMELASPTIDDAFARAVARGAGRIVVHPYFLLPGRHYAEDIPAQCDAASRKHGNVSWLITAPLSESPVLLEAIEECVDAVLEDD